MEYYQLNILLSNIYLALSFLANGIDRLALIAIGILWLLIGTSISHRAMQRKNIEMLDKLIEDIRRERNARKKKK